MSSAETKRSSIRRKASSTCDKLFSRPAYNAHVRGRYQIVLSTGLGDDPAGKPASFWSRFKAILIGMAALLIAVTVMVIALVFGSILAAVLWVCLTLVLGAVIVMATVRELRRRRG